MSRKKIEFYKNLLFVTLFVVTLISALGTANNTDVHVGKTGKQIKGRIGE